MKLKLSNNPLTDISKLTGCTTLEVLVLDECKITDYSPLSAMIGLEELSICNAGLSDISFVAPLANLHRIALSDNNISDISPLADKGYNLVILENNRITDLSALYDAEKGITEYPEIYLYGNPLKKEAVEQLISEVDGYLSGRVYFEKTYAETIST